MSAARSVFGLRIEDDSMSPEIFPGDIVTVDPGAPRETGSTCAVWRNGIVLLGKIHRHGKTIEIVPMTDSTEKITVKKANMTTGAVILGRVVQLHREF